MKYMSKLDIHHLHNELESACQTVEAHNTLLLATFDILQRYDAATTQEEKEQIGDEYRRKMGIDEQFTKKAYRVPSRDAVEADAEAEAEGQGATYVSTDFSARNMKTNYQYKKVVHLRDWIMRVQCKQKSMISAEDLELVRGELRKLNLTTREDYMSRATSGLIKDILKKLKKPKLYEKIPQIKEHLTGQRLDIPDSVAQKLENMFQEIQPVFERIKAPGRKSFLRYSFVLNKLFRLLDMPDVAEHFALLKCRDKQYAHEAYWRRICRELGWRYDSSY